MHERTGQLVGAKASRRGADQPAAPGTVDITVVLPVRNEGDHIAAVLGDLQAQALGALTLEILVVDGESTDDTVARAEGLAADDPRIRVLTNPRRLSSAARAIGAEAARGRFIAYVDGHCRVPTKTLLADMVALFERTGAACLSRPQPLVAGHEGILARAISAARTSPFGHSTQTTIYDDDERQVDPTSAGAMYRREVFETVGNFDPAFDACEDVEFNWRVAHAGLDAWTSPALAVQYEPRRSLRALWKQMVRYGLGRARLHRKHRSAFTLESLVPAGFVLGLPVLAAAPFLPSPLSWIAAAPYALYLVLSLVASAFTAVRRGPVLFPFLPAAFFVIHAGLGVGYLKGWLSKRPAFAETTS
ncbi:MAG: glycosyltransferase [Planctomycetota bacterium]|nr:glycosyltransferase [Planctomycetota bacterium]